MILQCASCGAKCNVEEEREPIAGGPGFYAKAHIAWAVSAICPTCASTRKTEPMEEKCDVCVNHTKRGLPCPLHAATPEERKRGLEEVIGDGINDGRSDVARVLVELVYGDWHDFAPFTKLEVEIRHDPYVGVREALKRYVSPECKSRRAQLRREKKERLAKQGKKR